MYTAADVNLTFTDTYSNYNRSTYKDYETSNKTDYSFIYKDKTLNKVTILLYSIIFALGTIGNGLVIWIAGFRMKQTTGAVWFLNLAIADFLCCASLPLRIVDWLIPFPYFPDPYCMPSLILFNLNVSASVLLLVAMSIDRCVSVMWPFWAKTHRTCKLVRITAAIIWALSLILTGFVFYLYVFYIDDINEWCLYYDRSDHHLRKIKWIIQLIRLFTMFVIPFLIILISYVIIFIKLRKCKRSQRSQRPYRIITALILCFFICWSPYYIWLLLLDEITDYFLFFILKTIIVSLACLNSCINPIIYVFMSQDVKLGFFRSIPSRLVKALSQHPNDQSREREDCDHTRTTDV